MLIQLTQMLSRMLRDCMAKNPQRNAKRTRPLGGTTESLESRRMLAAALVADVLSGTAGTSISGTVYEDLNSNGIKDGGENGVAGWTVYLDLDGSGTFNTDAAGVQEPSAITNVDGDYVINHLIPGTYRVGEVVQAGWSPTAPVSQDVVVVRDRDTNRVDFFNFAGGEIVGAVWNDLDGRGTRDVDPVTGAFTDPGLVGWTVFLDLNGDTVLDPDEPKTITDIDGNYSFHNVPAGDYEVTEVLPPGWEATRKGDIRQTAAVVALGTTVADFGNLSTVNGSIQGTVWNDLNANGVRDTDPVTGLFTEPGLEGWTVFLDLDNSGTLNTDALGNPEPSALTNADGFYSFNSLPAGDYEVTEVLPSGWNVSPTYDVRQTVAVFADTASVAGDFANFTVQNGSIRGTVWNDRFRDGIRDVSLSGAYTDPGLTGWQVFLDLNRNRIADIGEPSTLTDGNGDYTFTNLQVGDYEVQEVLPSGWEVTMGYSDSQTVTVFSGTESVAGDFANFNLGAATPGSVSGVVWNDINGNGVREVNPTTGAFVEPGLAGRLVFVDQNGNGLFDSSEPNTTSGADGAYQILGLLPGTVHIGIQGIAGWRVTSPVGGTRTIALKNGEAAAGVDFGNYTIQDGSLRGTVFADTNLNGIRDPGERGLDGITVYLDSNNNNNILDAGEQFTTTSTDQFFTPDVNEAGTYSFTHLAHGAYTVRFLLPETLSATPALSREKNVDLTSVVSQTGIDVAAVFRANEIHGVAFDDANGNHTQDAGESVLAGRTMFVDLNRNNVLDAGEQTAVSGLDGAYVFGGLAPGAYVVREILPAGHTSSYPTTTGGILWPTGTSNPAVGDVTPTSITGSLALGEVLSQTVSITLPSTGALTNLVDVFLLFDDTGSFVNNSPIVRSAFPEIIAQLQAALPGIDLGFGVGRFEEYGNFAYEYSTGRPFILNQPIVAASTVGYMDSIQAALNRTTPGYGGDGPETDIEALYQLVTGVGFDGNNNGSVLDSGVAGLASTQLNPGSSGDVPSFASFQADPANFVLPAAGNVGGGGFRTGALPIILTATDIGFAYQPQGETVVTGVGGVSLPVSALTGTSRATTPFSSGAGLQQTVTALDALGALVIGLGTNSQKNVDPRQGLEALSKLTGAVNRSTTSIDNGTGTPIAPGDPLYFQIASGFSSSVTNGVVNAIQNAVTNVAVDIEVRASDPRVKIVNHSGVQTSIGSGQTATFNIEFTGDGIPHRFDLQFVRAGTNVVLGSIPVVLGTPVPGDGYEFEDLSEGEIHHGVDFGSSAASGQGPTDLLLSGSSVAENLLAGANVGTLSSVDPDVGDTFTYSLVSGDTANFTLVGNQLKTATTFNFEAQSSYTLTIRTTDSTGLSFDKTFTISVANVNESPTSLSLSSSAVAENQPAGTIVGTLSTTDPDFGDTANYSLVAGDMDSFSIVGDQLQTAAAFDFETQSSYSVTIRTTDAAGLFYEKAFTISVTNVNEAPTSLALTGANVAENQPAGTLVGTLSTVDPDAGDTFTYSLVAGDVASFAIVGDQLQTAAVFNLGLQSSYSVTIRTTDAGGLYYEKAFTINVTNVNEAPTSLVLTGTSVAENLPAGTLVGTLSTVDPDAGDTFTYSLVAGDVASFSIVGDQLQTAAVFNLGLQSSYSVTIRTTDAGGLYYEKAFTINVTNVNEAPTSLALTGTLVAENLPAGTLVGTLSTVDPDAGDTFTYSLVAGDVASFSIVGDQLQTAAVFDFETQSSYSVTIRTTDAAGLYYDKAFTISVTNVNEAPTSIVLTGTSVAENLPAGTFVGTLSTVDPDAGEMFTYSLVAGDVASFAIVGDQLQTAAVFNLGLQSSYSVTIRTTDAGGLYFEKAFTINVTNVNEAPTNIVLTGTSVAENLPAGTLVGTLSTVDPDAGDTFTYSLVAGDVASFSIVGDQLQTSAAFDFEARSSYSVTIRTTDAGGLYHERAFTISVTNVNEAPTSLALTGTLVAENQPAGTLVGTLSTVDPDAGDTFTYSLVAGDVASFSIVGDQLQTAAVLSFAAQSSYSITIRTTDLNGLSFDKSFTVVVTQNAGVAPELSLPTRVVRYEERDQPVLINPSAIVTDADNLNFNGGQLSIAFASGGQVGDRLKIRSQREGRGRVSISGNEVRYSGVTIGTFVGGFVDNSALVISLNENATPTAVSRLLRSITFSIDGKAVSGKRTVAFVLSDGTGLESLPAIREIAVSSHRGGRKDSPTESFDLVSGAPSVDESDDLI